MTPFGARRGREAGAPARRSRPRGGARRQRASGIARRRLRHRNAAARRCGGARPAWRLAGVDASAGMLAAARAKQGPRTTSPGRGRALGRAAVRAGRSTSAPPSTTRSTTCPTRRCAGARVRGRRGGAASRRPAGLRRHQPARVRRVVGEPQPFQRRAAGRCSIDARFDAGDRDRDRGRDARARRRRPAGSRSSERYFGREEVRAALAAAGFAVEQEEEWSPFPVGGLGKTWWTARHR